MLKQRIEYIDALRGLCIFWVVWYHSSHPEWVEYPFRMPTLFFVSGIFFKHYPWSAFWRKKINQYVVPFFFFYLLYFFFLVSINYLKYGIITHEILSSFFDFVRPYSGNDGYRVNYPLWFMVALLMMQIVTYVFNLFEKSKIGLVAFSIAVTFIGCFWLWEKELPLFLGKASTFYVYYVVGYVVGAKFVEWLENSKREWTIMGICLVPYLIVVLLEKGLVNNGDVNVFFQYAQFMILPFVLLCLFKGLSSLSVFISVFLFLGTNSLIIFGLHDMFLSIFRILLKNVCDVENPLIGIFMVLLTLLLCWPTIKIFQSYIPQLVGKRPLLKLS